MKKTRKIKIGGRTVGQDEPLYFIADIASNHDGDLNRAYKLIELAKESGADAAKFQNFQTSKIVSKKGFEAMAGMLSHQKKWKKSVYEIYCDASIPMDWTPKLRARCDEVGIEYFTSAYDFDSVNFVDPFVNVYKIGSGDITWIKMIEFIAKKGKPVFLATGASNMDDVVHAMDLLESITEDIVLMQCNTNYTGSQDNYKYLNLNVLKTYARRFPEAILGLSDHTPGHSSILGAIALGARVIEKHFTDDNARTGPDHAFAINPATWKEMVSKAHELDYSLGDGIKRIEENEKETALIQRRALRTTKDLLKGHIIRLEDVYPLRPYINNSIAPYNIHKLIGRKIKRNISSDELIHWEDVE